MNISLSVLSFLFATELESTEKIVLLFVAKKIMYFAFFDFASSSLQSDGSRFESKNSFSWRNVPFRLVLSHPYRRLHRRKKFLPCGKCGKKFEQQFTSEVIQLALGKAATQRQRYWTWHSSRNGEEINRVCGSSERRNQREAYTFIISQSFLLRGN